MRSLRVTLPSMRLDEWLKAKNISTTEFARLAGLGDRAIVHRYRYGRQVPRLKSMRKIQQATGGEVTANDFVDQQEAPRIIPPRAVTDPILLAALRAMKKNRPAFIPPRVRRRGVKPYNGGQSTT